MLPSEEITVLLNERNAPDRLLELVYDDLRHLAANYMRNERHDHTLQATALVHEAFVRLVNWKNVSWENRAHFFAVAARVMREILVDHARRKSAEKRGGGGQKIAFDEVVGFPVEEDLDLLALEEALKTLENQDARQARIVELRFFGGLSIEETAHVLGISETTVKREWTFAKAWFQRELSKTP